MRSTTRALLAAALLPTIAVGGPLHAQESTTRGFTVGIHGSGATLTPQDQERREAAGGGIVVGYGVNRHLTLVLQADGAEFDDATTGDIEGVWTMGHFEAGVRYNFANSLRSWVPFLQASVGMRSVKVEDPLVDGVSRDEVELSGASLSVGGGIDFYLRESLAIDIQALWTGGEFTTIRVDNVSVSGFDFDARSTRFNIGILWWP